MVASNEPELDVMQGSVEEQKPEESSKLPKEETPEEHDTKTDEWVDLLGSGSIMKKLIRDGEPDTKPERLQRCVVNYECTLDDGTLVDKVERFEMYLGDCDVVQGLDVAIALMNIGERCQLKIAPRLAYGKKGLPGKVPEESPIQYEVELLEVHPDDDLETLTVEERKTLGNKKRERGNWWYCRGENNLAIQCYRRALNYLETVDNGALKPNPNSEITDADLQSLLEDRVSVCNNMAAAQLKLESYDAALISLQTVLQCQPNNVKALFRKAKVHKAKYDLQSALKCLQKAKAEAPDDKDVEREIATINHIILQQKGAERELARRMFNAPKKEEVKKTSGSKAKAVVGVLSVVGAAAVGLASVLAYKFKYA